MQLNAVDEQQPPDELVEWERQPPDHMVEENDPLVASGARDGFFAGSPPLLLIRRQLPFLLQGLKVLGGDGGFLPSALLLLQRGSAEASSFPHDLVGRDSSPQLCGVGLECASSKDEQ